MLEKLPTAKSDPILSLSAAFRNDERPEKIDLGIGVYKDNAGNTPIMAAVKEAEKELSLSQTSKGYVGLAGNEGFNAAITALLLDGSDATSRSATVQTPGASGALRLLGELVHLSKPRTRVWLSNPSYINHKPLMEAAGLEVKFYPYLDIQTMNVNVNAMLDALSQAGKDDVVLLHGCCHNPTGADISFAHWQAIAQLAQKNGFIPFVDIAYQGLGQGLNEDAKGVRLLAGSVEEMIIATSCSKNFGLYRERTGAAIVIGKNAKEAQNAKGCIMQLARATYTMPPDHGAAIVETILSNETLTQQWKEELNEMRSRIFLVRKALSAALNTRFNDGRFDFIASHQGMFSLLGLPAQPLEKLKTDFGIYVVGDGRVNMAGLNESSIDYFADALFSVTKGHI